MDEFGGNERLLRLIFSLSGGRSSTSGGRFPRLLLASGRRRSAFRFQFGQLELDNGNGFLNRFELLADAFDCL
jgi:hypothetical protein